MDYQFLLDETFAVGQITIDNFSRKAMPTWRAMKEYIYSEVDKWVDELDLGMEDLRWVLIEPDMWRQLSDSVLVYNITKRLGEGDVASAAKVMCRVALGENDDALHEYYDERAGVVGVDNVVRTTL